MKNNKAQNATEVLIAARWMLKNIGWCQGQYERYNYDNTSKAFCALGSIRAVETSPEYDVESIYAPKSYAIYFLLSIISNNYNNIQSWNDSSGQTKNNIIKVFTKAIKLSKAANGKVK